MHTCTVLYIKPKAISIVQKNMMASNITFKNISYKHKYCKYWEPDSDLEKETKTISLIILCVFGILSNIFIVLLAGKYTPRKKPASFDHHHGCVRCSFLGHCATVQISCYCFLIFFFFEKDS